MKKIAILTMVLVLLFPLSSWSIERSGQVIRELMEQVDQEMTILERKVLDFDGNREVLLGKLGEQFQSYKRENDFGKKLNCRADVTLTLSEMNKKDRNEVQAYLDSIPRLSKMLKQLSWELMQGGKFQMKEKFTVVQKKMRSFMTKSGQILEILNATMPLHSERPEEMKAEIEKLKGHLIGLFVSWDSEVRMNKSSLVQVDRTVRDLDDAYAQLVSISRLLENERKKLKVINWTTLAQIALIRLAKGKMRNGQPFLEGVHRLRRGISRKGEVIGQLMREPVFSDSSGSVLYRRDAHDEAILKRILRNDYD